MYPNSITVSFQSNGLTVQILCEYGPPATFVCEANDPDYAEKASALVEAAIRSMIARQPKINIQN